MEVAWELVFLVSKRPCPKSLEMCVYTSVLILVGYAECLFFRRLWRTPEYGTMSMQLTVYWVNSLKGLHWC